MSDLLPSTQAALDHWVAATQARTRQPSMSAAVARGGAMVWHHGVGHLDGRVGPAPGPDSTFRIASVTKTFVAVAVLRLAEQGRLELTDPISRFVADAPCADATIAQLLSHTSGMQAETDGDWWERSPGYTWEQIVGQGITRRLTPGRKYHYSNVGYAVLGRLIEQIHQRDWESILRSELLDPLGMHRTGRLAPQSDSATGWGVHPHAGLLHHEPVQDYRAMGPAGELWSSAADLLVWGSFLAGAIEGPLGTEWLEQMREPWCVSDLPGQPWVGGHSLGLQVWNAPPAGPLGPELPLTGWRRQAGHTGSVPGFTCEVRFDAESRDVAVTLGSATTGFGGGATLLAALHRLEPPPVTPWAATPDDAELIDLVGQWHWGPTAYLVSSAPGGGLELTAANAARGTSFRPDGPDRWVGRTGYFAGEPLTVTRDERGRARYLDVASFRITRIPYDPDAALPGGPHELGWH